MVDMFSVPLKPSVDCFFGAGNRAVAGTWNRDVSGSGEVPLFYVETGWRGCIGGLGRLMDKWEPTEMVFVAFERRIASFSARWSTFACLSYSS